MVNISELYKKRAAVEMWSPNGKRYIQAAAEDVPKLEANGFILKEKQEKEIKLHTTHWMKHDNVPGEPLEVNGTQIETMKARGYYETDAKGNRLEKEKEVKGKKV